MKTENKRQIKKYKNKGFSLPELMVVILIMAVLMAIASPMWLNAQGRARARGCQANLQIIYSAEKEWALDHPDIAVTGYVITSADINGYIDGGFASLTCDSGGAYSMPAIDSNGNIPKPVCSYAATDSTHAI